MEQPNNSSPTKWSLREQVERWGDNNQYRPAAQAPPGRAYGVGEKKGSPMRAITEIGQKLCGPLTHFRPSRAKTNTSCPGRFFLASKGCPPSITGHPLASFRARVFVTFLVMAMRRPTSIPAPKRRRTSRVPSSPMWAARRSSLKRGMSSQATTYKYCRSTQASTFSFVLPISPPAIVFKAFNIQLADLPGFAEFQTLYDQYQITWCEFQILAFAQGAEVDVGTGSGICPF